MLVEQKDNFSQNALLIRIYKKGGGCPSPAVANQLSESKESEKFGTPLIAWHFGGRFLDGVGSAAIALEPVALVDWVIEGAADTICGRVDAILA